MKVWLVFHPRNNADEGEAVQVHETELGAFRAVIAGWNMLALAPHETPISRLIELETQCGGGSTYLFKPGYKMYFRVEGHYVQD